MSFKICYIWIRKFRNFGNFGVNLSSKEKFDFNLDRYSLAKTDINSIPNNFFGENISDVAGFIGKNGTGKSNLLELICKLVKGGKTSVDSDFFIVIKQEDEYKCHYSFEEYKPIETSFPISFIDYSGDIDNLKPIYFSNVYDERTHIFSGKVSDLSANKRYPRNNWPSKTKTSDFVKQLQFINSELFRSSEIPIPKKVVITPKMNTNNNLYWQRGIGSNSSINEKLTSELKNFFTDIKGLKPSKQKLYYFMLFTIVIEIINQIRDFDGENFLLDESIKTQTNGLLDDIEKIKNTYKNKLDIANTWKEWCNRIIHESYKEYFKDSVKNKRQYKELQALQENIELLEKYEEFLKFKDLKFSTEGSRNRKTESYILDFKESNNRLDENFYNLMDSSSRFKLDWLGLSSGHKAYLDIFSQLRFDLKNIKTDNVLICIDEGDLYLHPKWQADFFYKLVNLIPKFKTANYQFILTSHSPFLVSDLPKQNLVFLGKDDSEPDLGIINDNENVKTFAGNLGELYLDAFFMEGNLISRFAADKIQKVVDKINKKEKLNADDEKLIELIGEDLIRIQIKNLLNDPNR
jgi:hypothetical protein